MSMADDHRIPFLYYHMIHDYLNPNTNPDLAPTLKAIPLASNEYPLVNFDL